MSVRVVLDTGILIAALITRDTPPDQMYQLWRKRRFTLITSEPQLSEFRRVTRYPKCIVSEASRSRNAAKAKGVARQSRHRLRASTDRPCR